MVYVFMVGLLGGRFAYRFILGTPKSPLVPLIAFVTGIGSLAIHSNLYDVVVMVGMGILGWRLVLIVA